MNSTGQIGVFFCMEDPAPWRGVDLKAVAGYARTLPGVKQVEELGVRPKLHPEDMAWDLKRKGLTTVVIAGDSPGFFKQAFTRAIALSGGDPDQVRLASLREHGAVVGDPTERAKAVVACAIYGVPFNLAAVPAPTTVNPLTLVIGGGVAGIQAALEIAEAGQQVLLVEKSGTIGGHMAMFDKTFPTLDCAACILTPKMVAVSQHPNIKLMTCAEVAEVSGSPGAFQVKILQHARYLDASA